MTWTAKNAKEKYYFEYSQLKLEYCTMHYERFCLIKMANGVAALWPHTIAKKL